MSDSIVHEAIRLPIKPGLRYVVTKGNDNLKKGTPIFWTISREYPYTLFEIMRVGDRSYKNQHNDVHSFKFEKELSDYLEGAEVTLDIKFAREQIDKLQQEISSLEENYELNQ